MTLALVVGGGSGIGTAVAELHRARGDEVVVWDRAGDVDVICDVRDDDAVAAAAAATVAAHGVPSMVTVTAGVGHAGTILGAKRAAWDEVMAVNVGGVVSVLRHLGGAMVTAEVEGSFAVVTSVSATLADRGMGAYSRVEGRRRHGRAGGRRRARRARHPRERGGPRRHAYADGAGARQHAVAHGRSPAHRAGPVGQADEVAAVALALHGLGWVTGAIVPADGGLSLHSPIDSWGSAPGGTREVD